jgi:hypothetical protein
MTVRSTEGLYIFTDKGRTGEKTQMHKAYGFFTFEPLSHYAVYYCQIPIMNPIIVSEATL